MVERLKVEAKLLGPEDDLSGAHKANLVIKFDDDYTDHYKVVMLTVILHSLIAEAAAIRGVTPAEFGLMLENVLINLEKEETEDEH